MANTEATRFVGIIETNNYVAHAIQGALTQRDIQSEIFNNPQALSKTIEERNPSALIVHEKIFKQATSDLPPFVILGNGEGDTAELVLKAGASRYVSINPENFPKDELEQMGMSYDQAVAEVTSAITVRLIDRVANQDKRIPPPQPITINGITVDINRMTLTVDGAVSKTGIMSLKILHFLMQNPDQFFSRESIRENIEVKDDHLNTKASLKQQVSLIRKSLGVQRNHIKTTYGGGGMMFVTDPEKRTTS